MRAHNPYAMPGNARPMASFPPLAMEYQPTASAYSGHMGFKRFNPMLAQMQAQMQFQNVAAINCGNRPAGQWFRANPLNFVQVGKTSGALVEKGDQICKSFFEGRHIWQQMHLPAPDTDTEGKAAPNLLSCKLLAVSYHNNCLVICTKASNLNPKEVYRALSLRTTATLFVSASSTAGNVDFRTDCPLTAQPLDVSSQLMLVYDFPIISHWSPHYVWCHTSHPPWLQ